MTDFLCPSCGPINEDDGLLVGPGDAVCCAFCGCDSGDMTPLVDAYNAVVRERDQAHADMAEMVKKAADKHMAGYRELGSRAAEAETVRDNAVQQAKMWAQEARTQKAIVKGIGELVGCENDWEMVEAVRRALASAAVVPQGWKLVPETPTFEMYEAGEHALFGAVSTMNSGSCYVAMLRAAPAPAEPDSETVDDQQATLFNQHNGAED